MALLAPALMAWEDRDHTLLQSEGETENHSLYPNDHQSVPFNQNANGSLTNHGHVKAAKDSYTTWIDADIAIWYLPAGGAWIKKYGLYGEDAWDRTLTITGVEIPRFVYTAKAGGTVRAQARLNRGLIVESGDVYARAEGELWFVDDTITMSRKECLAGTRNLDGADKPAIVSGSYTYPPGVPPENQNGLAAKYTSGDTFAATAELKMSIDVPQKTKQQFALRLQIISKAFVRVWVDTTNGWGNASIKHRRYPDGTNAQLSNDDWEVVVDLWDDDDADDKVNFKTYEWTKWGEE